MKRWLGTLIAPLTRRKPLGKRGETVAARYLRKQGYKIVMCNFEASGGEIDIVARKADLLVFVEVKTRRSGDMFKPFQQVNQRKKQAITRAARAYLAHYRDKMPTCRFDVLSIIWPEKGNPKIEHIINAFEAA